jgi:hypothetical protein
VFGITRHGGEQIGRFIGHNADQLLQVSIE